MFVMRRATTEDVSTLLKLAKMVHFINLPADKDIIADKASWSAECFAKAASGAAGAAGGRIKKNGGYRGVVTGARTKIRPFTWVYIIKIRSASNNAQLSSQNESISVRPVRCHCRFCDGISGICPRNQGGCQRG